MVKVNLTHQMKYYRTRYMVLNKEYTEQQSEEG